MALADFLSELGDNAAAATRGFGKSATLGLIQYPQAGLMKLVNGGTFKDNLANLREDEAQVAAAHPIPYGAGSLAGTALTAAGTGGGGLIGMAGRGAIQGGVSGFTQNEDFGDAAAGAGLGAVLGGAGRAVDYGKARFVRSQLTKHYSGAAAEAQAKMSDLIVKRAQLQAAKATAASPAELAQIEQGIGQVTQGIGQARGQLKQLKPKLNTANNGTEEEMMNLAAGSGLHSPLINSTLKNTTAQFAGASGLGAVLGGGSAALMGNDPVKGAMAGAGLFGSASVLPGKAAMLARVPLGATETAARAATATMVPKLVAPQPELTSEPHPWEDAAPSASPDTPAGKQPSPPSEREPWQD
jgi:hypothetical protein